MDKIQIIDQKFLESGHSHMEFGAIHSTAERAKKTAKIVIPSQWITVIQTARTAAPLCWRTTVMRTAGTLRTWPLQDFATQEPTRSGTE